MDRVSVDREKEFDRKLAEASWRLRSARISGWSAKPALHRLLLRCGVHSRPPHFVGFWAHVFKGGLIFTGLGATLMWLLDREGLGVTGLTAATLVVALGGIAGVGVGVYYGLSAARHRLPRWKDL